MKTMLLAAAAAATLSTGANAALVYGVDENNNLVSFNSAAPSTYLSSVALSGMGDSLQAIDFRPRTNTLYGLGSDNSIVTINLTTGASTQVSGPLALQGTSFAFDFNPTIDRLRIVSNTNQNYVFNPETNTLAPPATNVFYPGGNVDPDVVGAAYTSAPFDPSNPTATQLYSIDSRNDLLVRQANSMGTLTPVGALGVDLGSRTSFDIAGAGAFAQNGRNFYNIDLVTGTATLVGRTDSTLFGIAVAAVPEPATWAMMIGGIGAMGGMLRRRRRVTTTVRFA